MCGIVGYIGKKNAVPLLIEGLKALEYRGYDSSGISVIDKKIETIKASGKIVNLIDKLFKRPINGNIGIGHTRWATHGEPNEINAHPHQSREVAIVHNGIIENAKEIEAFLAKNGYKRKSQTDSELIAHLINYFYNGNLLNACLKAVHMLNGSFAVGVICRREKKLIGIKYKSPLIVGIGNGENFIASDVAPLLPYTNRFLFLEDGEIAEIDEDNIRIFDFRGSEVKKDISTVDWTKEQAEKGGYKHFMLKEIAEEGDAVRNTLLGRIDDNISLEEELKWNGKFINNINKVVLVACGTSYYAALVGRYILQNVAHIPATAEVASEFRYENILLDRNTLFIVISQSGETADTLESMSYAKSQNIPTLSIVNVQGSSIARMSDYVLYTHAGPEISVASTKAFVSQLAILYLFTLFLSRTKRTLNNQQLKDYTEELLKIPDKINETFEINLQKVQNIAPYYSQFKNYLYLGRGILYPIALEGALKLKEISYLHAEGYAAGEMKHGPIALIDKTTPSVFLIPPSPLLLNKTLSNIKEVSSRKGEIIAVATDKYEKIEDAGLVLTTPSTDLIFSPFLYIVPLQLFAYSIANYLGYDVDHPRNLAKSVTVE
ncbi:MAG: glutamine--fructose-6-phosphate transaminase (isomerizing) [Deltaproteobacteria bacterium]|nr:glutamine--fructose-6-phosphate transaminase (isomerizing) [Deltaproteobacteria bacterium]